MNRKLILMLLLGISFNVVAQENTIETVPVVTQEEVYVDEATVQVKYKQALNAHRKKSYKKSVKIFNDLLADYPQSKLAGNFQYWIGEALFLSKNYSGAIDAFSKVFNYEKCYKLDDAQYMLGKVNYQKGDSQQALIELETLLMKYPDSEYALKANKLITRIK